jgi:Mce-associated membrane protein
MSLHTDCSTTEVDTGADEDNQRVPATNTDNADAQSSPANHDADPPGDSAEPDDLPGIDDKRETAPSGQAETIRRTRRIRFRRPKWKQAVAYGLLPALALTLALAAGYLKWISTAAHDAQTAGINALRAANDSTVAILSYKPDSVDRELPAASARLTGQFKDAYTSLIREVVIPGAKEKNITSVATVPAAATVNVTENHAVILVFVNQTVTFGSDAPSSTASSVRITMDEVDGTWLISAFDPV